MAWLRLAASIMLASLIGGLIITWLDLDSFAAVGVTFLVGAPLILAWFEGSPELTGLPRLPWQRDRSAN